MKKLLSTSYNQNAIDGILLLLRFGAGLMMLTHGAGKFEMLFSDNIRFAEIMGMSAPVSLALTVFAEVLCSIFLILGLFTRFAAIPLIITMIVAVFIVHGDDPFSKQELGLHYLMAYIPLLILGGGKYALDTFLFSKRT